jgi:ubiquinone/menaquinone biosynthesis C-methylase UbiE
MSAFQALYGWACQRLYNEFAWSYDAVASLVSAGQWAAWRRLALACLPAAGRVLELGFGTGELQAELARGGWQVYGLEPSPAMQRITARKLRRRGLAANSKRVRGMSQHLPFPDCFFDAVVATFPANYIFVPQTAAEVARVLNRPAPDEPARRPGGRLVVNGIAVDAEDARVARLLPVFYGWPLPESLERWRASLADAGLCAETIAQPWRGMRVLTLVAERTA